MVNREQVEKIFLSLLLMLSILMIIFYLSENKQLLSSGMSVASPVINTWLLIVGVFILSFVVWSTRH